MNGVRSSIRDVLRNHAEFEDFEPLLEKCLSSKKIDRPKNMILLREEPVFAKFLTKIESGEKPTDIMLRSAPVTVQLEVKRLRLQNANKDQKIHELEERVKSLQTQIKQHEQNAETKYESEDESQSEENPSDEEETPSPHLQNERDLINQLGSIDGAGHFFQNDKAEESGGVRSGMKEDELCNIIKLLDAGVREINVKVSTLMSCKSSSFI